MMNPSDAVSGTPLPEQTTRLAPPSQPASAPRRDRPPRLALLATVLFNPIILVGYYLFLYGPSNTCVAGPLVCDFGTYPAILQIGMMIAGGVTLWLVLFLLARWLVETPYGERNALMRALRSITDTSKIRPLLLAYGLALSLGLAIGLFKREISPPIAVLTLFTIFACLHSGLDRDPGVGGSVR